MGVGTKKAGTTWWHELLAAHPEVYRRPPAMPGHKPHRAKELHFFEVRWETGLAAEEQADYHAYFPRPPGMVVGEWTPRYLLDCWTPALLRAAAPEARLLALVRDPIERFRSGMTHYLQRHDGLEHPRAVVEEVTYGRYGSALDRLTRHFPSDQVLVLQYERCVAQPERELATTYRFIGLRDDFVPEGLRTRVAVTEREKVTVTGQLHDDLLAEYEPDVRHLAERWPIDLSLWPNFAHLA